MNPYHSKLDAIDHKEFSVLDLYTCASCEDGDAYAHVYTEGKSCKKFWLQKP